MGLKKKRKLKNPLQYKKGFIKFLECKINLSKKPFIPRIETEYWVGKAIKEIQKDTRYKIHLIAKQLGNQSGCIPPCHCFAMKQGAKPCTVWYRAKRVVCDTRILDMFAGSGCIGIAVLKHIKNSYVDFTDDDRKSVEQVKINLKLNKVSPKRYKIYKSDLFGKLKDRTYNIIFANPPYVAEDRMNEVQKSVLEYEPKKALFSGKKGLNHIKRFLKEAKRFLKQEGVIYLEFDPKQKKEIEKILEKNGYKDYKIFKDQFKKYRWLKIP